ncbi:ribbon-helix-helix domain-containing protein [Azospirillum rugosum]|uniref:DNA-binding ribbon-helix-helix protein n=1 Tax=Azospirillum rugosum TaxID=416170 RepID=A0ABS4SPQ3_9PROT|nr:ribbon-helix-helix domain-containing protein [Azospirillum rugosum]MBP2294531.1 putative DNA-binding ribbon-helix-helix protein [Azospirillum rugosum]MDQ0529036.1 putative DNA-binding ribbon-helix-helix protein [Azospirillum rugosum]
MKMDRRIPRSLDEMADLSSLAAPPTVVSRSVTVGGRRTSLRLESTVWDGLKDIAQRESRSIEALCTDIDRGRSAGIPFATSVRVYVLNYFREGAAGCPALAV